ncbi:MAG TPA: hypothetical protein VGM30_24830 [Puia sp.]|jgi:hypothetical protein
MTQEAKLTLFTIERYLSKNPGMRLGQALYNLHIIPLNAIKGKDPPGRQIRSLYHDNDTRVMSRVIKSIPFRRLSFIHSFNIKSSFMPTNQEIDEQIGTAEDTRNKSLFPGMTFEEGVIAALQWVTGQSKEKPMDA